MAINEHIKSAKHLLLFLLDPQQKHGLNNVLLRALLRLHPDSCQDQEDNAHIHINSICWGLPIDAAAMPGLQHGELMMGSDSHLYIETERHVIAIATDLGTADDLVTNSQSTDQSSSQSSTITSLIPKIATKQNKKYLLFALQAEKPDDSQEALFISYKEFADSVDEVLASVKGSPNVPGNSPYNPHLLLFYNLLLGDSNSQKENQKESKEEGREESRKEDISASMPTKPTITTESIRQWCIFAEDKIKLLEEMRDHQQSLFNKQNTPSNPPSSLHCWLWYPRKLRESLHPDGLPFLVYEIEHPTTGKITLDLHYDVKANHWRMDIFRRPGRDGKVVSDLLQEKGIKWQDIDHQENYVPKYIVAIVPDEAGKHELMKLVDSIIARLIEGK